MNQTGFIVCVPEAEPLVGALRERFDGTAKLRMPAHITVLFPFMCPEDINPSVLQRVKDAIGQTRAFAFLLARISRFPATIYLEPEPAAPFIELTERLAAEFPEFPPFGGEFPTIIPHLTVAHGAVAEAEARGVSRRLLERGLKIRNSKC